MTVSEGNWTNAVKAGINPLLTVPQGSATYTVGYTNNNPNPNAQCTQQDFYASYKCGDDSTIKALSTITNAPGKPVNFNCMSLYNTCNGFRLYLGDDGILTLKDSNDTKVWDSKQTGANPIPLSETIGSDYYTPTSSNRAPAELMPYTVSYLNSGEHLNIGQFLGSPTGRCRLEMGTESDAAGNITGRTLQVVYDVPSCTETDIMDSNSSRLYSIPWTSRENLGKMGYVNNQGQLQVYPGSMVTTYTDNYKQLSDGGVAEVGNTPPVLGIPYGIYGGDIGAASAVANVDACKENCRTVGQSCIGFEYESKGKTCQLKGLDAMTNGIRRYTPADNSKNYQYYARLKGVSGLISSSCPSNPEDIAPGAANEWTSFIKGDNMSPNSKCGLLKVTENELAAVETADATIAGQVYGYKATLNTLYNKYQNLKDMLFQTKTNIGDKFNMLNMSKQNMADWSGEQGEQLDAMNEDRGLSMMTQNYKHIMWSILAIIVVLAILVLTKFFGITKMAEMAKSVELPNPLGALPT